jgi:hypothetical protein
VHLSVYASAKELAFMESLDLRHRSGRVGSDASGVYIGAIDDDEPLVVSGGLEGIKWFGEPIRSQMSALLDVLAEPCAPQALPALERLDVRWIYLGATPTHWTLPGYRPVPGRSLAHCPAYELVKVDPRIDAWFYRVRQR